MQNDSSQTASNKAPERREKKRRLFYEAYGLPCIFLSGPSRNKYWWLSMNSVSDRERSSQLEPTLDFVQRHKSLGSVVKHDRATLYTKPPKRGSRSAARAAKSLRWSV